MESIELDLLVNWIAGREYEVSIVRSPFGKGAHRFVLPESSSLLTDMEAGPAEELRDCRRPPAATPPSSLMQLQEQGIELSRLVFSGGNRDPFRKCLDHVRKTGARLRLRLIFRNAPAAADWPWEALVPAGTSQFLAIRPGAVFERAFELPGPPDLPPVAKEDELRLLLVGASPEGFTSIGLRREKTRIAAVFKKAGVRVDIKTVTSRASLDRATASQKPYDIVHLSCHGDFECNQGGVWLEGLRKDGSRLASPELPAFLRHTVPSLVILNACHSARSASDPFSGFPGALMSAGTSAVVAMRRPITDSGAIQLAEELYRQIAAGEKLGKALAHWRATAPLDSSDWAVPVLYLACDDFALWKPPPSEEEIQPVAQPPWKKWLRPLAAAFLGAGLLAVWLQPGRDPDPEEPPVVPADNRCPSLDGLDFSFIYVEPGSFDRGTDTEQKVVTLTRPYCLAAFELTRGLYARIVGSQPPQGMEAHFPVEKLTWNEARQLVDKLATLHPEAGFRLPTDAEWEFAARAGRPGDEDEDLEDVANCRKREKDAYLNASAVGSFAPNAWGFYDMRGNVWEWVADWEAPYTKEAAGDPTGPADGEKKIRRGGSYMNSAMNCRYSTRAGVLPDREQEAAGVRIARSPVAVQN